MQTAPSCYGFGAFGRRRAARSRGGRCRFRCWLRLQISEWRPGAPAFLYIAERLQASVTPPLSGWFGHAKPFAFESGYRPAPGITRAAVGTPPVISLAALEVGVDLLLEADMQALRRKSLAQSRLFAALAEQFLGEYGFELVSPRDDESRGSQVCLSHLHAWPITQALIERRVIGDFRAPDILRFGFTPLYLGYVELWDAMCILRDIMERGAWIIPDIMRQRRLPKARNPF